MNLLFPSLDVLRLALTSAAVPAEVQKMPAQAIFTEDGAVYVAPAASIGANELEALKRLSVSTAPALPEGQVLCASCWLQITPLERTPAAEQSIDKGAVLFRLESSDRFAALAAEMLRLGNDRQSFRHVRDEARELTLLRVVEPPFYSLLSALDSPATRSANGQASSQGIAYVEQAPRVWVQIGFRHPLAERIDPPAGQFVLLDAPNVWHFIDEGPYQDLYQSLEMRLPAHGERWSESSLQRKIEVPLRLVAGNSGGAAELWVLRERGLDQIEQLITRSDDALIGRLAFAVLERPDEPIVVLRVRPSRQPPPVLVLDALACCTYLKLPNLFLPIGKRLNPPLRRDAIAKLLAADNQRLTWLEPQSDGGFMPISIADSAFRPLEDWIEYIIDREHEPLTAWIESHRFDFESFVCYEDAPRPSHIHPEPRAAAPVAPKEPAAPKPKPVQTSPAKTAPEPSELPSADVEAKTKPNVLAERLKKLEQLFLESSEPTDSPMRTQAWREMGLLNSHLKHPTDTTVCWCNGLWNEAAPDAPLMHEWLLSELRASHRKRIDSETIDEILGDAAAGPQHATLLGAYLIYALASQKGVGGLRRRSAALVQFFRTYERYLPVRCVWLIALALHQLSGSDTLGLARTRDRILERLFEFGLQAEFDIAGFMRGGTRNNDRGRTLRAQLPGLLQAIDRWVAEPVTSALARNKAYATLIGAYGLAKLGEAASCRGILEQTSQDLGSDPIHKWLARAFEYRIEQVIQGTPDRGTLPDDSLRQLEQMDRLMRYKVDRLRQQSRILEPHERIDPYRRWHRRYRDELFQTLAELQDVTDHDKLRKQLEQLIARHSDGEKGIRVMASALELSPRLGEQFGLKLLGRVDGLLDCCDDTIEKTLLLQRAIYVSAHFGNIDALPTLVQRLNQALPTIVAEYLTMQPQYSPEHKERVDTVEALFLQSFRGLRKLGMRDQVAAMYSQIADTIRTSRAAERLKGRNNASEVSEVRRLRLMLCLASGWYYFGKETEASEAVEQVRTVLFQGGLSVADQRALAAAYAHTVAHAPIDYALQRIQELFAVRASGERVLPKIEDTMTTSTHFSVAQIELIEAAIVALLSEEAGPSAVSQRWLDDDEFSIRKRIHADMKAAMK